jgi:hypothetical protein
MINCGRRGVIFFILRFLIIVVVVPYKQWHLNIFLLFQTTMDAATLLLSLGLLITAALLIFTRNTARARIKRLINLLPGPPAYPIVGSFLPYILLDRKGN